MQRKAPLADRALLARIARRAGTVTVVEIAQLFGQDTAWVRQQLTEHAEGWTERRVKTADALFLLLFHFAQSDIERALGEDITALPENVRTESLTVALPVYLVRALRTQAQETATKEGRLTASLERYITERLLGEIEMNVEEE